MWYDVVRVLPWGTIWHITCVFHFPPRYSESRLYFSNRNILISWGKYSSYCISAAVAQEFGWFHKKVLNGTWGRLLCIFVHQQPHTGNYSVMTSGGGFCSANTVRFHRRLQKTFFSPPTFASQTFLFSTSGWTLLSEQMCSSQSILLKHYWDLAGSPAYWTSALTS